MAVAPAFMADKIIVLDDDDDDEEESPRPTCSSSVSSSQKHAKEAFPPRAQQPAATHITQSPFASAKKDKHVLQAENQRLFTEFVEHCSSLTQSCPEVLTFLQTKHAKASPEYLSSVEFRNTLGRCLTRTQANRSKAFVYINELCTALRQHAVKRRQTLTKVQAGPSTSSSTLQFTSDLPKRKDGTKEEEAANPAAEDKQPSTSGLQEGDNREDQEAQKRAKRASRKQMIKIYEKLCELKSCSTLTGRVIEQRIRYNSTRYPEINKKIERFINSPEAQQNPPDYQDILQQVLRANERHNLCLSRKQLNQMAQEAFRETGGSMQERRHLDLVYNFGSRLTDAYKPAADPALSDPSLLRKLRSNREVALSRLEGVITRFAIKQEDTEEQDRARRLEKDRKEKEAPKSENGQENKEVNGLEEEEEDDDDEDDESSDPDIEEEMQASTQQDGPDGDENDDDCNEAECEGTDREGQTDQLAGSVSAGEEESVKDEDEEPASGLSPLSDESKSQISPLCAAPSPKQSPSQSEPMQTDDQRLLSNGNRAVLEEPVDSSNHVSVVLVSTSRGAKDPVDVSLAKANGGGSLPLSPVVVVESCDTQTTNGTSPPLSRRATRSQKRKREDATPENSRNNKHILIRDSEVDVPLDTDVFTCISPQQAESTRADTPTNEMVSSSQSTPPPKKNKVNVATQCDPDEVIVLSDSE
uniref:Death domain-associated protein 6 n=1 Tax=Gasterosteus aculeatus aculeatus TaxID=481459 RepID=A0AAQ4RQN8_GASAC